jgi:hypothetical protein
MRQPSAETRRYLDKIKQVLAKSCRSKYLSVSQQEKMDYFRFPKQNGSAGLNVNILTRLHLVKDIERSEKAFNGGGFAEIFKGKISKLVY